MKQNESNDTMSQQVLYQYFFNGEQLFALPDETFTEVKPVELLGLNYSDEKQQEPEITEVHLSPFRRLKSRFVIIVNTYGEGLREEEEAFLRKVLNAVKYGLDEVDLFDLEQVASANVLDIFEGALADYVLLLGVKPEQINLGINLQVFQPRQENGVWLLLSNSLKRIEMEESLKRSLWMALKKMFF